jgi:hypothetical protein
MGFKATVTFKPMFAYRIGPPSEVNYANSCSPSPSIQRATVFLLHIKWITHLATTPLM